MFDLGIVYYSRVGLCEYGSWGGGKFESGDV